jgi:hypothetical protein
MNLIEWLLIVAARDYLTRVQFSRDNARVHIAARMISCCGYPAGHG